MVDKKYLNEIYAIHPKLLKKIRKAGTKTGSKVFGGWKEGSDIDFIMPPDFMPDFDEAMRNNIMCYSSEEQMNYRETGFISGYMKTEAGTILNLLFMQTEGAYRIWTEATAILKDLVEKYPQIAEAMQDKKQRVQFFEMLKEVLE